jgi:UDP-N-acetylmuramoylalanine--D-glutamate ligase
MQEVRNKRVTVFGLGHFGGGINVSRWLAANGSHVLVTDKESPEKLADSVQQLAGLPIEYRLGEHRAEDFTSADLVVISPAIPPSNEYLIAAKNAGVPITLEIQLFIERCPAKIVGVTATKGKSTTTAMLGAMLRQKHTTYIGGNLGGSLLFDLPKIKADDCVVLELSSYMLEHLKPMKWSPHVAVVGMIGRDHLAWHGSEDAYVDAKKNIVRFQTENDFAILNEENPAACGFANQTRAKVIHFGTKGRRPFDLPIAGAHNQLNAQGAFAAANVFGISWDDAQRAMHQFQGLPHRLQLVHESNGVKWINDSIATIPEAAVVAMQSYPAGKVIQIVGGYDKQLDMRAMCETLAKQCKAILTIGALGPKLAEMIRETANRTANPIECGDLEHAVAEARKLAQPGDIVLLSTGCASYDQFTNFESRGDLFTKLARLS